MSDSFWLPLLPYAKLLTVFALMLLGMRLKWGLALSALLGSFVLALLFDVTPLQWVQHALSIFSDRGILTVWGVIILVLSLSSLMEQTGQAERFMRAFARKIASPVFRLIFFPILIGLLPMPGGAVFSAPMINAVAKDLDVPDEDKSLINYWFRHSAEPTWPLFPSLILAAGFAGMSTPELALWTCPMTVLFMATGCFFYVRPLRIPLQPVATTPPGDAPDATDAQAANGSWWTVLLQGAPIFTALAGAVLSEVIIAFFFPDRALDEGVLIALALAVGLCLLQNRLSPLALPRTWWHPEVRTMILIVGALGVFKNVLVGGGVVNTLVMDGSGLAALWLTATVLPFMVSSLTGIMIACVGSIFPLLVVLVQNVDGGAHMPQWLALALASGLTGAMLTPLHICFVLSCEYFHVDMMYSWRRLPLPALTFWVLALGYFFCIMQV